MKNYGYILCVSCQELHQQWKYEHKYLLKKFRDILKKRKSKGAHNIDGVFYESSKFTLLTKVILEKSDLDFQPQINSDSDTDEATPPKRGRPSESSKSFLDLKNDRMRKNNT